MHLLGIGRARIAVFVVIAVTLSLIATLFATGVLPTGRNGPSAPRAQPLIPSPTTRGTSPHGPGHPPTRRSHDLGSHLKTLHPLIQVPRAAAGHPLTATPAELSRNRPNIVFVLTDDLSTDLVRYMPHLLALKRRGMSFTNYTVSNSLCCPSRASIFTGELPHNTGVRTNTLPNGGYPAFQAHGDEWHSFAVNLRRAGYRTGFYGKYLNGYNPLRHPRSAPGWTDWGAVDGKGYRAYGYNMSENGRVVYRGYRRRDYLTSVLDRMGQRFIRSSAAARTPFALEVATFSPHSPYVAAPADLRKFQKLRQPRTPEYNKHPKHAVPWLAARPLLGQHRLNWGHWIFRKRVRCVQSVDRMLGHLQTTLRRTHQLNNTIFVFSSDNGFHISDYGLAAGKRTAFDTDVKVPLVVAGPGIKPGSVNSDLVENIDLAPTFARLAHARFSKALVDGHSFEPLLFGKNVAWRTLAVVEHTWPGHNPNDPDEQGIKAGDPPSYTALRGKHFTYVRYQHYAAADTQEYYNRARDPHELDNIYGSLSNRKKHTLEREAARLTGCAGYDSCWRAGHPK